MKESGISFEQLGEPCRNFNILNYTTVKDPLDNREKLLLSNYVAGGVGSLIFIDSLTGEGESVELPGDGGAWGLLNWRNQKVLVGTCPDYAYIHCLDLKTRTWEKSLRDDNEKYIWKLAEGSDGMIYGCTYPGCSLLRYDPINRQLINLGRVSDNPKNLYARPIFGEAKGYIIVNGGYEEPFMKAWDIQKEVFIPFGRGDAVVQRITNDYIYTESPKYGAEWYDPVTLQRIEDDSLLSQMEPHQEIEIGGGKRKGVIALQDGRRAGVRGQEYFIADRMDVPPALKRIPTEAPATRIHTLTSDAGGGIWGSSEFGQTIFHYDPQSGEYWNTSAVCDEGGEVYGMVFVNKKLYMTSYIGGDHIVYDPEQQWDQINNMNPKTLRSIGPELVRPESRSVLGPDGNVWTGWAAKYGTYGGGISCICTSTYQVKSWNDPIPGQQVTFITADDRHIYFTTNSGGNGLENRGERNHLVVWSSDGAEIRRHLFEPGSEAGALLVRHNRIWIGIGTELRSYDLDMSSCQTIAHTGKRCTCILPVDSTYAAFFVEDRCLLINTRSGSIVSSLDLPGPVHTATLANETIYFAVGKRLFSFHISGGLGQF